MTTSFAADIRDDARRDVADLLERLAPPAGGPFEVSLLPGGTINRNYVVAGGDERYVLRAAPPRQVRELIAIDTERATLPALRAATPAGLTPALVAADEDGNLILRFADGPTLSPADVESDPSVVRELAALLREVHALDVPDARPISAFDDIETFAGSARAVTGLPAPWERVVGEVRAVGVALGGVLGECFCHRDCNPQNVLVTADGLQLIDWDYAGRDTPYLDLAVAIEYCGLEADAAQRFARAYAPDWGEADDARLRLMRLVHNVRDGLYAVYAGELLRQETNPLLAYLPPGAAGETGDFYRAYADHNLARAQWWLADDGHEDAVRRAAAAVPAVGSAARSASP